MVELQPLHISALVALAVFTAELMIARAARVREQVRRRATGSLGVAAASLDVAHQRRADRLMERAAVLFAPGNKATGPALRHQLEKAGIFSDYSVALFYAARALAAAAIPLVYFSFSSLLPFDVTAMMSTIIVVCLALLGLVLPLILLNVRIRKMQQTYRHMFPDVMDLLVVCVESGQSLQSAIARVSQEMMQVCPELGFNLHLVSLELRAGNTLHGALHGLHSRLGLDEVQSLAVLLKQSEELGASISGSLRVFSDEMREKRLIRAETKANTLPVKMTIPLGLFIFPVILLVIMVPVIIRIRNAFL